MNTQTLYHKPKTNDHKLALIEIFQGKRNFFYTDDFGETISAPAYCHWRLGKILEVEKLQPIPYLDRR